MSLLGVLCWVGLFVVWFGVLLPRNARKQDRLWRKHREEQRRLDRAAGVRTRGLT